MAPEDERTSWNERYRAGSHGSMEPDPLLVQGFDEFIRPTFPRGGEALDLAGGLGRHAIWLAQRNWRVTLTDVSEVGIAQARENAGGLAKRINFEVGDANDFGIGRKYDLVIVFFFLQRNIFPELLNALRPGGLLVYKTYTRLHAQFGKGPTHPMHLLEENELLRSVPNTTVLHYNETIRDRGVAELVARTKLVP